MKGILNSVSWGIALGVWMSGAILLWEIWLFQKTLCDPLSSYIEFSLMFVATFYILALVPLKCCARRILCRGRRPPPALVSS